MTTKNFINVLALVIIFMAAPLTATAQTGKRAKADTYFKNFDYARAIPLYERLKEKEMAQDSLVLYLADAYFFTSNWEKTVENYSGFQKQGSVLPAQQVFRYVHALKSIGDISTANSVANAYINTNKEEVNTPLWQEIKQTVVPVNAIKTAMRIKELDINSGYADMTPSFFEEGLLFASARDTGTVVKRTHGWNQKPFLDLYQVSLSASLEPVGKARKLNGNINTKVHESSPVFNKDGTTLFFTRNLKAAQRNGMSSLGLFSAVRDANDDWRETPLPFNDVTFSTAHAALSPDGKTLYFSSNRPGGFGNTDIYRTAIENNGSYGPIINMGKEINTAGHDSFPFIDAEGRFFFSSNGHAGFGGLDVFTVEQDQDFEIANIFNMGDVLNSPADDFGFIVNTKNGQGFLTSNRSGGKGDDDIFGVMLLEPVQLPLVQPGIVLNAVTKERLPNVDIFFSDATGKENGKVISDARGGFSISVPLSSKNGTLKAYKNDFLPQKQEFGRANTSNDTLRVYLQPEEDLAKLLKLDPIYFDFDKATILEVSKRTLDILVAYLKNNMEVNVQIGSHTDSRGNDGYNLALSGARALETKNYLVSRGIAVQRLQANGFGESQLKNKCANGIDCSEDEHRLNRRSEFMVVTKIE